MMAGISGDDGSWYLRRHQQSLHVVLQHHNGGRQWLHLLPHFRDEELLLPKWKNGTRSVVSLRLEARSLQFTDRCVSTQGKDGKSEQGIKLGTKLFLFDFDVKLPYDIYEATSNGQLHLEPDAFNGNFPAQVKFMIFKECLPLPQSALKVAIKDNYQGSKLRQELSSQHVNGLILLFCPLTLTSLASSTLLFHSWQDNTHFVRQVPLENLGVCGRLIHRALGKMSLMDLEYLCC